MASGVQQVLRTLSCRLTLNFARDFEGPQRAKTILKKNNHVGDLRFQTRPSAVWPEGRTNRAGLGARAQK